MAVKHSIEKPTLPNFVNLSTTFCQRLSEEAKFHLKLSPDALILHFLKFLISEKSYLIFKFIFKATQLQKIPEYDIFQEALFFTLPSSMNLRISTIPVAAGQYL